MQRHRHILLSHSRRFYFCVRISGQVLVSITRFKATHLPESILVDDKDEDITLKPSNKPTKPRFVTRANLLEFSRRLFFISSNVLTQTNTSATTACYQVSFYAS